MKRVELSFLILLASALGAGLSAGYLRSGAGLGGVALVIYGAILTTAIFSLAGGRARTLLGAMALLPPFGALCVSSFPFDPEFESLGEVMLTLMAICGLVVVLPLSLLSMVT